MDEKTKRVHELLCEVHDLMADDAEFDRIEPAVRRFIMNEPLPVSAREAELERVLRQLKNKFLYIPKKLAKRIKNVLEMR